MSKVALITGASSGLGEAIAKVFKEKDFRIIGVCRTEPKTKVDCWIKADITKESDRQEVLKKVEEEFGELDVMVNAAGKGNYATWTEFSETELRELFELNFFALVNMTCKFLPLLKKCKGTVINISSIAGKTYVPCMGPYCASKFSVFAFGDSLRAEIKNSGVKVLTVAPGRIHTDFSKNSAGPRTAPHTPSFGGSPEKLARKVYTAYKRKRRYVAYPLIYVGYIWATRMFPRFYDWAARKAWGLTD